MKSWEIIKQTLSHLSRSLKRLRPAIVAELLEGPFHEPLEKTKQETKKKHCDSTNEPPCKKRKIATQAQAKRISALSFSLFEPRIVEGDFPPIDSSFEEGYDSGSLIFSSIPGEFKLFTPVKKSSAEDSTSLAAKAIEVPVRNPRRSLHELASKFEKGRGNPPIESKPIKKRYSNSHISFDASETTQLIKPSPPLEIKRPSIPSAKVIQLANDINLDESAVGSLLVILSEDAH